MFAAQLYSLLPIRLSGFAHNRAPLLQIASLIGLPSSRVEAKLGSMILDKKLDGTLDAGKGTLLVFDKPQADVSAFDCCIKLAKPVCYISIDSAAVLLLAPNFGHLSVCVLLLPFNAAALLRGCAVHHWQPGPGGGRTAQEGGQAEINNFNCRLSKYPFEFIHVEPVRLLKSARSHIRVLITHKCTCTCTR